MRIHMYMQKFGPKTVTPTAITTTRDCDAKKVAISTRLAKKPSCVNREKLVVDVAAGVQSKRTHPHT